MKERRKIKRHVSDSSYVIQWQERIISGRIIDYNIKGVSCITNFEIPKGSIITLKLNFTGETINIKSRIVSSSMLDSNHFRISLFFYRPKKEILDIIKKHIKEKSK
jgi:hypothetical protein